jgi:hypothetical protein
MSLLSQLQRERTKVLGNILIRNQADPFYTAILGAQGL